MRRIAAIIACAAYYFFAIGLILTEPSFIYGAIGLILVAIFIVAFVIKEVKEVDKRNIRAKGRRTQVIW
jgi:hypothetical protein